MYGKGDKESGIVCHKENRLYASAKKRLSGKEGKGMKYGNVEMLIRENEELSDLLEDLVTRIQEIREEFLSELDDLEDMITGR